MTVDGSVFHKPQIGPAYAHNKKYKGELLAQMYRQEHFVPISDSGVLQLAYSKEEMIRLINYALKKGASNPCKNEKMLKRVISFMDGKSTDRVADVLKDCLAKENRY